MDAIARAKDELSRSRTFKRMDDYVPSCIEEKKAVEKAQADLAAEEVRHGRRGGEHDRLRLQPACLGDEFKYWK